MHASVSLYIEGLRIHGRYRIGWYDSLIVAGAIEGQCSVLYSEDLQHGLRIGELLVQNPFA